MSGFGAGGGATAQQQGKVRVIVMFAPPVAPNDMRRDQASIATVQAQVAAIQDAIIAGHFGTANPSSGPSFERGLTRFSVTPGFAIAVTPAELEALAADSQVISIQQDRADPLTLLQSVPLIGMTAASASSATGANRAVAVLDTGIQSNHEFLTGKVVAEACFSNASGSGGNVSLCPNGTASQTGTGAADATTAQCVNGSNNICDHGTHVSGIAAGNNTSQSSGEPTNGVARSAKIVAVQVFTRFNNAADCSYGAPCVLSYTSDQMRALDWLYTNALTPASGIALASANMSLGGSYYTGTCDSDSRKASIDNLRAAGVATVISSGNSGYTDGVGAPGCISTAVTVGSSTKADVISSFSNMSNAVDLMAPGSSILSSIPVPGSVASYASWNGTSMAAPHVAGAFAAIKTACPSATVAQIETALKNTGIAIADTRSGGTVSKPRIRVDLAIAQLGCSTATAVAHDFDGNGKSDIAWRNASGNSALWLMNGNAVASSAGLGTVPTSWSLVGQRDFNGDGKSDWLWQNSDGNTSIWFMNGTAVSSSAVIGKMVGWTAVGTGDFNGDGKGDILWRNAGGTLGGWLMNGSSITSSAGLGTVPTSWTVAAVADFNGDGKADILWRNASSSVVIWFMNGLTPSSSATVGTMSGWTVAGVGDLNGDGKADIVWRNNSTNMIGIWLMNGSTIASSAGLGSVPAAWSLALVGDFNGDGKSDLLWRHTSGTNSMWLMNGTGATSASVPTLAGWTLQATNAN